MGCCDFNTPEQGGIYAYLVSQKNEKNNVYFYSGKNYIYAKSKENITSDQINQLKIDNDWGKRITNSEMKNVQVNTRKKRPDFNMEEIKAEVCNLPYDSAEIMPFAKDFLGRWMVYVKVVNKNNGVFRRAYMMLIESKLFYNNYAYEEIQDVWNCQNQFAAFKEANWWDMSA